MARGKIQIQKIEDVKKRHVTFSKRRGSLMRKAHKLSDLCNAEVGVIVFSQAGKLFEFASSSMDQVLSRFNKCSEATERVENPNAEIANAGDVAALSEEIEHLKQKQAKLLGKKLDGIELNELQELEQLLIDGLCSVKERKKEIQMHQLQQSKVKEPSSLDGLEPRDSQENHGISGPHIASLSGADYANVTRESQLSLFTGVLGSIICTNSRGK